MFIYWSPSLTTKILGGIFEKFKEKKQLVVVALRDAADAAYLSVSETRTGREGERGMRRWREGKRIPWNVQILNKEHLCV